VSTSTSSIIFTDIVGSTVIRGRVGETAADELFRGHERAMHDVVMAHNGTVVKTGGDGILASFDSATDAVRAAVALQQRTVRDFATLSVRVGIASGDVSWEGGECFGMPVITAARLQALAAGGQIVASALVCLLAGERSDTTFTSLGRFELAGITDQVEAFEVEWAPASTVEPDRRLSIALPGAIAATAAFSFVGRLAEWDELARAWESVNSGERRTVLIGGEAGAGKTRLAFEFARSIQANGPVVLGVCDAELAIAWQPWVQALTQIVRAMPADLLADLSDELADLATLVPALGRQTESGTRPRETDPHTQRFRLYGAVDALLAAVTAVQPIMIIIDDLHWADVQTIGLLRHLARADQSVKLLVLGTFRDTGDEITEPLAGCLADLRRVETVQRIRLGGLDDPAVSDFVERAVGHGLSPDLRSLATMLRTRTGGNAFFVSELWRDAVSRGAIVSVNGTWQVRHHAGVEADVPDGVREVVGHRLTRLSPQARTLVGVAAVARQRIEFSVLARASGLSDVDVGNAIDDLIGSKFLVETARNLAPRFEFTHAIVRESVEATLAPSVRTSLHLSIAKAIESIHQAHLDPVIPDLARHYLAAAHLGTTEKALLYNRMAALHAARSGAYDIAVAHLEAVLPLAEPGSADVIDILLELGAARTRGGNTFGSSDDYARAFSIAKDSGRVEQAVHSALGVSESYAMWGARSTRATDICRAALALTGGGDDPSRIRLLASLGRALALSGSGINEAVEVTDEAVAAARRLGDDEIILHALSCRLHTNVLSPHDYLRDSRDFADLSWRSGDLFRYCWARHTYTRVALTFGWVSEAAAATKEIAEIAACERFATLAIWAASNEVILAVIAGRFADAERIGLEIQARQHQMDIDDTDGVFSVQMFAIRREQGRLGEVAPIVRLAAKLNPSEPTWRPGLAVLCAELGMLDEARHEFATMAPDGFASVPRDSMWPCSLTFLAEVCVTVCDVNQAHVLYSALAEFRGLTMMAAFTMNFGPAERLMGSLAALLGRNDDAHEHFVAALLLAENSGSPVWIAQVKYAWAVALGDPGGFLPDVYVTATSLGMTTLADRSRVALDALDRPKSAFRDGLSAREVDVLRLVADGRSNREIGESLFISQHTVANHVRAILQKTGCANRADAAAYATRHSLVRSD
jgi:class 3 adenylate cyclase/DNA-binding CsgD family transcriptional regulator